MKVAVEKSVTMPSPQPVDPAIVAYLGAAMALLKLWDAESRRIVITLQETPDDSEQPVILPSMQHLESIRATVTTLPVPEVCQAIQQAFLQGMDQGLAAYQALFSETAQAEQRVAMLSGVENFARLDAALAHLERQCGPFDIDGGR